MNDKEPHFQYSHSSNFASSAHNPNHHIYSVMFVLVPNNTCSPSGTLRLFDNSLLKLTNQI